MPTTQTTYDIYEQDYPEWLDITLNQLQNRDLENIDWEHLIEEIYTLGNEQRRKVDSYLLRLLIHLLLYNYWQSEKDWCGRGWAKEIDGWIAQQPNPSYAQQTIDKIWKSDPNERIAMPEWQNLPNEMKRIIGESSSAA
ncbi:MAG: DUF29 domain-containing protein, partial [Dolichospermum sp.]